MEKDGDQGEDAAPIKPVSSLRAKFENLQTRQTAESKPHSTLRPVEPKDSVVRASLDLPRPHSPWSTPKADQNVPRTPGPKPRLGGSPTRSNHKRPMSLNIQSSPQLAPSVQIESPSSPPKGLFHRNQSRSPQRKQISNLNKVKEVVKQSSTSSTRAPSPGDEPPSKPRSRSPVPPPINRADKPKIPAKPSNFSSAIDSSLAARPLAVLNERRVSPFSTPPSSDEDQTSAHPKSDSRSSSNEDQTDMSLDTTKVPVSTKPVDPRSLGFSSTRAGPERRDPRSLGFGNSVAAGSQPSSTKAAISTAPRLTPVSSGAKDARDLGFGSRTSTPVTSQAPPLPQPSRGSPSRQDPARQTPVRDARHFGFSTPSSTPATPIDGVRPDLPQRNGPKIPPPRPSEDSKRPAYIPGISRPPVRPPIQSNIRRSEDVPRHAIPAPSDMRFPPPPKRGTFNEELGSTRQNDLAPPSAGITRRRSFDVRPRGAEDSDEAEEPQPEPTTSRHDYPDSSHVNRRPPLAAPDHWQINGKSDGKAFDLCGKLLCTGSYNTRLFDVTTGEEILTLNHGETVKTTSVVFKPGADIKAEGRRIWIGNNIGDLQEVDLETHATISHSSVHHRSEIYRIFRHHRDLWSLDEAGKLFVWNADETGVPNMKYATTSHKLLAKPTFAMVVQDTLWVASGRELRVYRPGHEASFSAHKGALPTPQNVADITCGTFSEQTGRAYIGHADGKVSIYSLKDYSCITNFKISDYKINSLAVVGDKLWAVYKTGKVYVYDLSTTPWQVRKIWKAHEGPATSVLLDSSSVWLLGRLQVATTGHDGYVRLWDGMLEDDWLETTMHAKDEEFCTFRNVRASVTTWNAGAVTPMMLNTHFIADAIHTEDPNPPEILVFGFQEVVDLEDRAVTAKSLFGFGKKKESRAEPQQHQSRVYRDWRDYLARCINKYLPQYEYMELHTSSLIGLFSCIFIRTSEKRNVTKDARKEVKCGMGGHYGNKGALLCRFVLDSTSLCFVNCHLAAGQSQTAHRNNDVATILESDGLPPESDLDLRANLFVGGGDGRQILDHEICILNGDLNYRIDTLPRATVIKHITTNNLAELLKRDQLNVSRQRVAGFRLASFTELPLTFPPTYKYDVGSDNYDSSEKKRSPAWCDRILYRAPPSSKPRVQQLEYVRHEGVRYSDHRPVSGLFNITVKKVDDVRRKQTLKSVYSEFEKMRKRMLEDGCVSYLVNSFGIDRDEARRLIRGAKS